MAHFDPNAKLPLLKAPKLSPVASPTIRRRDPLDDELAELDRKIDANENIEVIDFMKTIFKMNKEIRENQRLSTSSFSRLDKKTDEIDQEVKELKLNVIKLENEVSGNCLILRGVKLHPNASNRAETFDETKALVDDFLKIISVYDQVAITDVVRFGKSKDPKKTPIIKIRFLNKHCLQSVFSNLKNLQKSKYSEIRVSREVPQSLLEKANALELEAYLMRQKDKKIKTKVIQKDFDMQLMKKGPDDETFKKVEVTFEKQSKKAPKTI